MADQTPNLKLRYIYTGQEYGDRFYNQNLIHQDLVTQLSVIDRTTTPPSSPNLGDRYLIDGVGAGGGLWTGHENEVTGWYEVPTNPGTFAWYFRDFFVGLTAYDQSLSQLIVWNGSTWDVIYS